MATSDKQKEGVLNESKPDYGRGMRKLRGILDLSQKEMAVKLNMLPQQLSIMEKKEKWSEEQLKRVSETFDIPLSGLDYLANEKDLLNVIFTDNTQEGNENIIALNNSRNSYHFGNSDRIDELFTKFEKIANDWATIKNEFEDVLKNIYHKNDLGKSGGHL